MPLINPQSALAHTNRTFWLIHAVLLVVFVWLRHVSTPENALAVAFSLSVLAIIVQNKWAGRRDPRLWAVVGIVGAVQVPVLFLVRIPHVSTGLVFYPFGLLEFFVLWGLFGWMERRFPRT